MFNKPVKKEKQEVNVFQEDIENLKQAGLLSEDEFEGYAPEKPLLVFTQIRQKDLKDDLGNVIQKAGGFKYNDGRPDTTRLEGIILMSQAGRVYFEHVGDTQPKCKSLNGITSIYGDKCVDCPHYNFHKDGSAPDCKALRNLLFLIRADDKLEAVIFTIGPSGLKAWRNFYTEWMKKKIPPHYLQVQIESEFKQDKGEYYIPKFSVVAILKPEMIKKIKEQREKLLPFFGTSLEKENINVEEEEKAISISIEEMKQQIVAKIPTLDTETQKQVFDLLAKDRIQEAYNITVKDLPF